MRCEYVTMATPIIRRIFTIQRFSIKLLLIIDFVRFGKEKRESSSRTINFNTKRKQKLSLNYSIWSRNTTVSLAHHMSLISGYFYCSVESIFRSDWEWAIELSAVMHVTLCVQILNAKWFVYICKQRKMCVCVDGDQAKSCENHYVWIHCFFISQHLAIFYNISKHTCIRIIIIVMKKENRRSTRCVVFAYSIPSYKSRFSVILLLPRSLFDEAFKTQIEMGRWQQKNNR